MSNAITRERLSPVYAGRTMVKERAIAGGSGGKEGVDPFVFTSGFTLAKLRLRWSSVTNVAEGASRTKSPDNLDD